MALDKKIFQTDVVTIYLDVNKGEVHYFSSPSDVSSGIHDVRAVKGLFNTDIYFQSLKDIFKELTIKYAPGATVNASLILPDLNVFTDTVVLPVIRGTDPEKSLNAYLMSSYSNVKNLILRKTLIQQTKQAYTFQLLGVMNNIIFPIRKALAESKVNVQNVSFVSGTTNLAFLAINPKIKNENYLFLDIKEGKTRIIYSFKGRVLGFFSLPFGKEILSGKKLAAEDVLTFRPVAELACLNAREKARQKALTMMGGDASAIDAGEGLSNEEVEDQEGEGDPTDLANMAGNGQKPIKTLTQKTARKLPKFMLRETPTDEEGMIAENFRLFVKWTISVMYNNKVLMESANIKNAYVNLPKEYDFIYPIVNQEAEENGITFVSAGIGDENKEIKENLELYGASVIKKAPPTYKF